MGFEDREKKRTGHGVISSIINDTAVEEKTSRGRPKEKRETKKRVTFAVLPSVYEDIQKIAYVERKSVSELIAQCFEEYITKNSDKLREYKRIKGE